MSPFCDSQPIGLLYFIGPWTLDPRLNWPLLVLECNPCLRVGGVIGLSLMATTLVMGFSVAFAGKFLPNFDLKNVMSVAYTKRIFDGKKEDSNSPEFEDFIYFFKSPDICDKFQ